MKKKNDLIIDASTVELSHLDPGKPVCVHIGENTLVAVPERITAMEAVNVINALTGIFLDWFLDRSIRTREEMTAYLTLTLKNSIKSAVAEGVPAGS